MIVHPSLTPTLSYPLSRHSSWPGNELHCTTPTPCYRIILSLVSSLQGMREGKRFIHPILMMLQTREASQSLKQQLSRPTCQPRASICDWPAATYPENMNTETCFPSFCYTVSFSFVSALSSMRKSSLLSQQSAWKMKNTTFFPALFDSLGDSLVASLGQRGLHKLQ